MDKHYPPKEQIDGLSRLLMFLSTSKIYWRQIELSGDTIVLKAEPPEGEIDLRVFYIYEDGGLDDDGFREGLY